MSRPTTTETLATAVARLPRSLRAAMLAAVQRERIITGAYVDGDGMCPLLGAHRYGPRESGEGFVEAWDRFCRIRRGKRRDATEPERAVLIGLLKASLFPEHDGAAGPAAPQVRRPALEVCA